MDDITDDRLREIAAGTYCGFDWDEGISIARELLAARAERDALKAEVERLRGVIRSYVEWRNPNLDDCESEEFHAALSALRDAAEEPKP